MSKHKQKGQNKNLNFMILQYEPLNMITVNVIVA